MKIENWKQVRPFEFYLTPLNGGIKAVRDELLKMNKQGPLFRRYVIEENKDLAKFIE